MTHKTSFFGIVFAVLFCGLALPPSPALADAAPQGAIALYGQPKYKAGFQQLDYVNPDAPKGGDVRYSALGSFDNLNPFILKGETADGAGMVFDSLMTQSADEPFTEYGMLAATVSVSDDRRFVTFTLRKEARFNDGTPVTPEDVIWTFNTLKTKGHPFYRAYYADVEKVEKAGDNGVRFSLKATDNRELPLIIGQMPVLPEHAWTGKDFSETTLTPLLGSGPYRVKSLEPGHDIVYERVADWWGKDLPINRGRFNFATIRYDYYRDEGIAIEALLAGRYDFREENIAKAWATAYDAPAVRAGLIKKEQIKNNNPSGMQGFVYNTRRPIFADRRVRDALAYALDFEWANAHLAYGAYTRTKSYFENSYLASSGLPSPDELKILEPYRKQLPPEVFTSVYAPPKTDGSGNIRPQLKTAFDLLQAAGWEIRGQQLVNVKTGQPFSFEILIDNPAFERWVNPFIENLKHLGINARLRLVDPAQYQNRMNDFDFDMTITVFSQSLSPGNEERDYWMSDRAGQQGSHNLAGIHDPVVDALTLGLIGAKDEADLIAHAHALDRVLLWGYYVIPQWYIADYRIAYWDKFGKPKTMPKYGLGVGDTWWIDPGKAAAIAAKQAQQPQPQPPADAK